MTMLSPSTLDGSRNDQLEANQRLRFADC